MEELRPLSEKPATKHLVMNINLSSRVLVPNIINPTNVNILPKMNDRLTPKPNERVNRDENRSRNKLVLCKKPLECKDHL